MEVNFRFVLVLYGGPHGIFQAENEWIDFMGIAAGAIRYPLKKILLVVWFGKTLKRILIAYTCFWIVEWITWLK